MYNRGSTDYAWHFLGVHVEAFGRGVPILVVLVAAVGFPGILLRVLVLLIDKLDAADQSLGVSVGDRRRCQLADTPNVAAKPGYTSPRHPRVAARHEGWDLEPQTLQAEQLQHELPQPGQRHSLLMHERDHAVPSPVPLLALSRPHLVLRAPLNDQLPGVHGLRAVGSGEVENPVQVRLQQRRRGRRRGGGVSGESWTNFDPR